MVFASKSLTVTVCLYPNFIWESHWYWAINMYPQLTIGTWRSRRNSGDYHNLLEQQVAVGNLLPGLFPSVAKRIWTLLSCFQSWWGKTNGPIWPTETRLFFNPSLQKPPTYPSNILYNLEDGAATWLLCKNCYHMLNLTPEPLQFF